jgi:hypothetical protein
MNSLQTEMCLLEQAEPTVNRQNFTDAENRFHVSKNL